MRLSSIEASPKNVGSAQVPRALSGMGIRWVRPERIPWFSEAFLAMLTPAEFESCSWRPVAAPKRVKLPLFEISGVHTQIRHVKYTGASKKAFGGWRCETCGYSNGTFHNDPARPKLPTRFLSAADLPVATTSMFVVGPGPDFTLCFTRDRWRELVKQPGAKGAKSSVVGIIPESRADRSGPRPTLREWNAEAAAIGAALEAQRAAWR
jgi:hypothetical protein